MRMLFTKLAVRMVNQTELIGAVIVMTIVFMMVLPLPVFIIDTALSLNICIATLLAIQALFMPHPLAFSTFPAVLLLTTMFRLALSVATTRMILLQHDAGHVVETFGNFVAGGNLAVGLVIFLILTLVNFLVITKGAERVAEVSARFNLDAMPGKQMAIDSDLRSGLIDTADARVRREQLTKESQLFGAMDGAMKFVKGDAISGIIIVFINLIGGFAVGILQHGMPAADAMHIYSILSIGDGLVAQIPALLISLAAGIIITRVNSDNAASSVNIGGEIIWQLTRHPKAWIYCGIIMALFAVVPGMPAMLFTTLSLLCLTLAFLLTRQEKLRLEMAGQPNPSIVGAEQDNSAELTGYENVRRFFPLRPYLMQFHPQHQQQPAFEQLLQRMYALRNDTVFEYGLTLPSFELEGNEQLAPDEFRFCVYEVPIIRATYDPNKCAVNAGLVAEDDGTPGLEEREEQALRWFDVDDHRLSQYENEKRTSGDLILARMQRTILSTGWKFVGLQESKSLVDWLRSEQPELADELERCLPIAWFSAVLQRLAAEHVTLRPLRLIAETLIKNSRHESNLMVLTEQVRHALREQICYQYSQNETLNSWLLAPATEAVFRQALNAAGAQPMTLSSVIHEALLSRLAQCFPTDEETPCVLLVEPELRGPLAGLLRESSTSVPVLAFSELIPSIKVQIQGRIDLETETHEPAEHAAD